MIELSGIIPPVTTCFHPDESLAPEKLKRNLQAYLNYPLAGFLLLGSNGEAASLSAGEKLKVLDIARNMIPGDRVMLAGTGCQSTKATIDLTREASIIGVDAVLVLNPFYYKGRMNGEALYNHYQKVADSAKVPILIYNMPAATGIDMDAELICRLSRHSNIIGLKDSGGNLVKMAEITGNAGTDFTVLCGSAGFLYPALTLGARGGILAFANIAPQKCVDLYKLGNNKNAVEALRLQQEIVRLNTFITRRYGVAALKAAMDILGLYGGPARSPLLPLEESVKGKLHRLLEESGIKSI